MVVVAAGAATMLGLEGPADEEPEAEGGEDDQPEPEEDDGPDGADDAVFPLPEEVDGPAWGKTRCPRASSSGSRKWSLAKKPGFLGVHGIAPGFGRGTGTCFAFFATVVLSAMIIHVNVMGAHSDEEEDDG